MNGDWESQNTAFRVFRLQETVLINVVELTVSDYLNYLVALEMDQSVTASPAVVV